jgi:hypothetical protein
MKLTKCESCESLGAVVSNDPEGNLEIQRCDDCKFFDSDQDARKVYSFKTANFTRCSNLKQNKLAAENIVALKRAKQGLLVEIPKKEKNQGNYFCQVRLPEEMGVN